MMRETCVAMLQRCRSTLLISQLRSLACTGTYILCSCGCPSLEFVPLVAPAAAVTIAIILSLATKASISISAIPAAMMVMFGQHGACRDQQPLC